MQVSIENVGKLGRKLTVRLPAQGLEDKVRTRIQEMGRSARLKGFRPGKVPTKVIEQRFGRQIRNEALSEMIGSSFQEAVSQEKLRPAVQPAIQTTGTPTNGEIEYTATFEVMPEIGTIEIGGLEIVKPTASVSDADIDTMIETLRQQRRSFVPVERAAHGRRHGAVRVRRASRWRASSRNRVRARRRDSRLGRVPRRDREQADRPQDRR